MIDARRDVELLKYHGLGNDFLILLDANEQVRALDGPGPDWPPMARLWCDRHRGIGADGFINARPAAAGSGAALVFELWNADGSEAETSGNGLRCLAHAALDAGVVTAGAPFGVVTAAGVREVAVRHAGTEGEAWAAVEMGEAKVREASARVRELCNVADGQLLVDMGNPHLVLLGGDPAAIDVGVLGPALQATEASGLNVEFVALGPGRDEITIRVWERGVGETMACGSGACAAAVAMRRWGRVGGSVTVHQRGGAVAVELRSDGTVVLSGPSHRVAICRVGKPCPSAAEGRGGT